MLSWRSWGLISFVDKFLALHWNLVNRIYYILLQGHHYWEPAANKALLDFYERHNEHIRNVVPRHNLLEYSPGDGWEELCEFLEVAKPQEEFPHINGKDNFLNDIRLDYWTLWLKIAILMTTVVVMMVICIFGLVYV
jgi:hypothetical protein